MSIATANQGRLYGLTATFDTPGALLVAARRAYESGYRHMDAYSPVPVEGLAEVLGRKKTIMPLIVLGGGIVGGTSGYFMQWFSMTYDYPFNIGGRPFHSWPMFIPVTFELTVLFAAVSGVLGMLLLNGLPRLHHPIFNAPGIERATLDRFVLCIEATDPKWSREGTWKFMAGELQSHRVAEVAR